LKRRTLWYNADRKDFIKMIEIMDEEK